MLCFLGSLPSLIPSWLSFEFNEEALLDQDVVLEGFFALKLFIPDDCFALMDAW